jgi:hypothetical protein
MWGRLTRLDGGADDHDCGANVHCLLSSDPVSKEDECKAADHRPGVVNTICGGNYRRAVRTSGCQL